MTSGWLGASGTAVTAAVGLGAYVGGVAMAGAEMLGRLVGSIVVDGMGCPVCAGAQPLAAQKAIVMIMVLADRRMFTPAKILHVQSRPFGSLPQCLQRLFPAQPVNRAVHARQVAQRNLAG